MAETIELPVTQEVPSSWRDDPSAARPLEAASGAPLDVSVLVPVLNEEATVASLAERVLANLDAVGARSELLFIDDGSTDGTSEEVRRQHERDPRVRLIRLRRNFGKAAALSAGVDHSSGRILITMDGDLQDDPDEVPRLLQALEDGPLDLVSGWKRTRRDPWRRRLASKVFNWVTRTLSSVELHDFNSGFKAYRREVLEQVAVYGELHRYIPVLANRRGFAVGEIQVAHHPRRVGRSRYGWDRAYKGPVDLITVLFISRFTRRPLHLFGPIGLISFVAGLSICAYLATLWFAGASLSNRPLLLLGVLLMVLGIQIVTTGLIGELITFKNFHRRDSYSVRERVPPERPRGNSGG